MSIRRCAATILAVSITVLPGLTFGQDYPNKVIRVFTSPAGGGTDLTARMLAQALALRVGQPVVVENRALPVLTDTVSKSAPDGYTLMVHTDYLYFEQLLRTGGTSVYDIERDFSPISMITTEPQLLVIHPSVPAKSVKELIALAKTHPGQLNYASNGVGSVTHLAAALFANMANINIVHIPYKGSAPAFADLLTGVVQVRFAGASSVLAYIKANKLRLLAVTSAQPSTLFPGLPTISATIPGYSFVSMLGVFAPAKTPAPIINRLNQEFVRIVNQDDIKQKLQNAPAEVVGSSPEQLSAYLKSEIARWAKVIKDTGIKLE